jgi:hypothetical protein
LSESAPAFRTVRELAALAFEQNAHGSFDTVHFRPELEICGVSSFPLHTHTLTYGTPFDVMLFLISTDFFLCSVPTFPGSVILIPYSLHIHFVIKFCTWILFQKASRHGQMQRLHQVLL